MYIGFFKINIVHLWILFVNFIWIKKNNWISVRSRHHTFHSQHDIPSKITNIGCRARVVHCSYWDIHQESQCRSLHSIGGKSMSLFAFTRWQFTVAHCIRQMSLFRRCAAVYTNWKYLHLSMYTSYCTITKIIATQIFLGSWCQWSSSLYYLIIVQNTGNSNNMLYTYIVLPPIRVSPRPTNRLLIVLSKL